MNPGPKHTGRSITPALFDVMAGADAVLVDGTFWTDDEMPKLGLSTKTARAIGHLHTTEKLWQDSRGRMCVRGSQFAAKPPAR